MKKKGLTAILIVVLAFVLVNAVIYAYWGRRHSILYDVDTVHVSQSADNANIYYLTYSVSVKNWWFDFIPHTYRLEDYLDGSPGMWHFETSSDYFTSTCYKTTIFDMVVEFDITTYDGDSPDIIADAIGVSKFCAYNREGNEVKSAKLYMSEFPEVEIIYS